MNILTTLHPSGQELSEIKTRFNEYAKSRFPGLPDEANDLLFTITVKDDSGELLAGIIGNIYWNGLEIDTLWVMESQRRKGIGKKLIREAEELAKKHGAVVAFLKTVEAKKFYAKQGYEIFGILEDRPIGTLLYHMKKRIEGTL